MSSLPSVQAGQCVVLQRCGYMKMHTLATEPPFTVNVGKEMVVDLSGAIGKPFGTTFRMMMDGIATNDKGKNARKKRAFGLQEVSERVDVESLFVDPESSSETDRDNRSLLDENSSQALSREEIEAMKAEGRSAIDIVTELVDKSASFANKTKYSQAKFLKKKANKYSEYLLVRRPSIRLLSQIMYAADPLKIMNLRVDSLSQLLNQANVRAGGNFIVYESGCQGLVVAAALERLAAAQGKLVHIYQSGNPQVQHLNAMNFDDGVKSNLVMLNMYHLRALERGEDIAKMHTNLQSCQSDRALSEGNNNGSSVSESNGEKEAAADSQVESSEAPAKKVPYRQQMREQSLAAFELMKLRSMDGLVIVSRQHSTALLMALLPYLAPSRSFAVYSPYKEPLLDAYLAVKESGSAVMVTLSETWLRQYQVLPERTHPKVQMSGGGGYILSGIVVEKTDSATIASNAKQTKSKRAKLD